MCSSSLGIEKGRSGDIGTLLCFAIFARLLLYRCIEIDNRSTPPLAASRRRRRKKTRYHNRLAPIVSHNTRHELQLALRLRHRLTPLLKKKTRKRKKERNISYVCHIYICSEYFRWDNRNSIRRQKQMKPVTVMQLHLGACNADFWDSTINGLERRIFMHSHVYVRILGASLH